MPLSPPAGIPADGSWRVWFVPSMSNPATPSLATDLNGSTTVDGSCLLTKDGISPDVSVDKYKDERLCTINVFEQNGAVTYSLGDLTYIADPQGSAGSAANKLYALVGAGWSGYMVVRWGMAADVAPATAQKVWVFPVSLAPSVPLPPAANTMTRVKQPASIIGAVQRDVAIAA